MKPMPDRYNPPQGWELRVEDGQLVIDVNYEYAMVVENEEAISLLEGLLKELRK